MKNLFTLLFFAFIIIPSSFSQQVDTFPREKTFSFAPSYWMGIPVGDFQNKMDKTAHGVGAYGTIKIKNKPLWAGGSFGYLLLDREKKFFRVAVANTGLSQKYKWRTAVEALYFLGQIRYQSELDFSISPYLELNAGIRRLYTRTTLHEVRPNGGDDDSDELVDSELESADWNFVYGGTFGFQINLLKSHDLALDVRCSYLRSGAADFYSRKNNPGQTDAPIDVFEPASSTSTDMLFPQVGLVVNFPIEEN